MRILDSFFTFDARKKIVWPVFMRLSLAACLRQATLAAVPCPSFSWQGSTPHNAMRLAKVGLSINYRIESICPCKTMLVTMSTPPPPLVSHLPPLAASAKFEQTNPMMGTLYTRFTQPKMRTMLTQPGLSADVLYLAHCELKFTSKYAYAFMGARDAYKSLRRDMWDRVKQLTTDKKQAETASFYVAPPALPITLAMPRIRSRRAMACAL